MATMRIYLILSLMLLSAVNALADNFFIIGVAPHSSARVILEMYQPLRHYLEKALSMPVEIVTAPDFDTFARRGVEQEFDLAITTGHQARLFQTDAGYIPLLTYKADFKAVALVTTDSPIRKPSDLRGKQVLGLSPASLVTLWGLHWLKQNRLDTSSVKYVSASDSVAQLILSGDAAAGFMSQSNYQNLAPDVRRQLRILAESKAMAGRVYLLNRRHAALQKRIETALWAFAATPEAATYFKSHQLEGYRALRPNELKEMEPYANVVRKILKSKTK